MNVYVLDTHVLVWYLDNDTKLPKRIQKILDSEDAIFVIPTIVLAEIKYLFAKKRIGISFAKVIDALREDSRVRIHPFDFSCVELLNTEFDLHDGMIVATAILFRDNFNKNTFLITKDEKIRKSGLIKTIW
jgi:PIN domain nuclease of toxin-antitoxin system